MKIRKAVALKLVNIMRERKITQYRLEIITGINHSTMGKLLYDNGENISARTLFILAKNLGYKNISEFLDDELFNFDKLDIE